MLPYPTSLASSHTYITLDIYALLGALKYHHQSVT